MPPNAIDATVAVPACEVAAKVATEDRRILFQLGRAYYAANDFAKAHEQYERADALGSPLATTNLGVLYENGRGVPADLAKAQQLYGKAAAARVAIAMSNLGWMYESGRTASNFWALQSP